LHDWSDPELPIAGGESVGQVRRRVASLLAEIDPTAATVLVSHGDAIRSAIAHLLGHSVADAPWIAVPNGSVARFDGAVGWLDLQPTRPT
jgi:probable phosphoglycerate mutase